MPARNIVKHYTENSYYHVYNRGVEKRTIFIDEQDCQVFLYYMKVYLLPLNSVRDMQALGLKTKRFEKLNLHDDVELLCFALMPNHFHLLLRNKTERGIRMFMQRLTTAYVMYFNKKYNRIGSLFQNIYKASLVTTDSYLLHLSRYIHLNSSTLRSKTIDFQQFSSLPYFLETKHAEWINPKFILSYFESETKLAQNFGYMNFMSALSSDSEELLKASDLTLEFTCD